MTKSSKQQTQNSICKKDNFKRAGKHHQKIHTLSTGTKQCKSQLQKKRIISIARTEQNAKNSIQLQKKKKKKKKKRKIQTNQESMEP